jgi:hypothetical protein
MYHTSRPLDDGQMPGVRGLTTGTVHERHRVLPRRAVKWKIDSHSIDANVAASSGADISAFCAADITASCSASCGEASCESQSGTPRSRPKTSFMWKSFAMVGVDDVAIERLERYVL